MVSFVCNACGQTVKKNRVEKHYQFECPSCSVLSCIDCGQDFEGNAYSAHTSCLTEAEKYQGKLYKAKEKGNKGEVKQQNWIKQVQVVTGATSDPKLKGMLDRISAYSNVPRKKGKFQNFCRNSLRCYDEKLLNSLWELFCQGMDNKSINGSAESNHNKNQDVCNGEVNTGNPAEVNSNTTVPSHKERKRKREQPSEPDAIIQPKIPDTNSPSPGSKFHWQKTIKRILQSCPDKEIPIKKLRKKVIAEYQSQGMDHRASTLEESYALFEKKLAKYPKAKVQGKTVKLR